MTRWLMVFVHHFAGTPWDVVVDDEPGADFFAPPNDLVTHLCAFACPPAPTHIAVWAWTRTAGWSKRFVPRDAADTDG